MGISALIWLSVEVDVGRTETARPTKASTTTKGTPMTRPPIEDRLNTLLTGMSAVTADDEVTAAAEKLILQTLEVLEPATEAGRLDLDAAKAFIDAFRAFEVSSMNFEAREIHTAIEDRHKELKTYIE